MTTKQLEVQFLLELAVANADLFFLIEVVKQLCFGKAQSLQQYGRVELAAAVDPDIKNILRVKLEVHPAAAVRNNPRGVQKLTGGAVATLIMVKEDPGRTMQLRHHDALGAVDDKGPGVCHQRNLAEVNLLLLHVANGLDGRFFIDVPNDESDDHFERRSKAHTTLPTFIDGVLRLFEGVADKLYRGGLLEILNRKDRPEHAFKANVLAFVGVRSHLQKLLVAIALDFDEVRDFDGWRNFSKILPWPREGCCQGGHRALLKIREGGKDTLPQKRNRVRFTPDRTINYREPAHHFDSLHYCQ